MDPWRQKYAFFHKATQDTKPTTPRTHGPSWPQWSPLMWEARHRRTILSPPPSEASQNHPQPAYSTPPIGQGSSCHKQQWEFLEIAWSHYVWKPAYTSKTWSTTSSYVVDSPTAQKVSRQIRSTEPPRTPQPHPGDRVWREDHPCVRVCWRAVKIGGVGQYGCLRPPSR